MFLIYLLLSLMFYINKISFIYIYLNASYKVNHFCKITFDKKIYMQICFIKKTY